LSPRKRSDLSLLRRLLTALNSLLSSISYVIHIIRNNVFSARAFNALRLRTVTDPGTGQL
jgi:hypothetical protein